ncbi:MAG: hypothetical protein LBL32_00155 [Holosporales bacterium]|jgi:hypothetical protein|nr:hypothetical protein [Holosporales bacterium]
MNNIVKIISTLVVSAVFTFNEGVCDNLPNYSENHQNIPREIQGHIVQFCPRCFPTPRDIGIIAGAGVVGALVGGTVQAFKNLYDPASGDCLQSAWVSGGLKGAAVGLALGYSLCRDGQLYKLLVEKTRRTAIPHINYSFPEDAQ